MSDITKVSDTEIKISEVVETTVPLSDLVVRRQRLADKVLAIQERADTDKGVLQSKIKELDSQIQRAKDLGVSES